MGGFTRRDFVRTAAVASASAAQASLSVPVHRVIDQRAQYTPAQLHRFSASLWPEAVRDFGRCGIHFQSSEGTGEVRRSPGDRPIFVGLQRGVLNLILTDRIPMNWDSGRALSGVTTIYESYHLCVIALSYAHGHRIPFLSVNTCVHELLHALLQDIFISRPKGLQGDLRESRIDWYATRLWLFHDGAAIRKSAEVYLSRLRSAVVASR